MYTAECIGRFDYRFIFNQRNKKNFFNKSIQFMLCISRLPVTTNSMQKKN